MARNLDGDNVAMKAETVQSPSAGPDTTNNSNMLLQSSHHLPSPAPSRSKFVFQTILEYLREAFYDLSLTHDAQHSSPVNARNTL